MFTKKPDKEPTAFDLNRPTPPLPPGSQMQGASIALGRSTGGKAAQSTIGADLVIVGNLVSKGEVHVDGEVQGDLHAVSIVIGDNAQVTGALVADDIVVRGTVMGSIRGKNVTLQSSSRVEGDIFHTQLAIEQGAYFEGKSRRSDDPISGAQHSGAPMGMGRS